MNEDAIEMRLRISEDLHKYVKDLAAAERRSVNAQMNVILEEHRQAQQDGQ